VTTPLPDRIAAANAEALRRIHAASPVLTGVRQAKDAVPALRGRVLAHAGPAVPIHRLCGPMRGAIIGALRYEGWAQTPADAEALLDGGGVRLLVNHDLRAVGPMAGILSPSMPLVEVRDAAHGGVAYAPLNEGIGAVLRFGANDNAVITRLRWLQGVLAPALDAAVRRIGGLPLAPLMARALTMGDEMHQRNIAATSLFYRAMAPALAEGHLRPEALGGILRFLADTDQFFLNLAMAAAKVIMDAAAGIAHSTVVTAMSRNGVEFGIRVSGLGDRWFVAPSPVPVGLLFPGHTADDANPDIGDSAIIETLGLGAFAMAAAPAVTGFVGLPSAAEAIGITRSMGEITLDRSPQFKIPALDFEGAPTAIDIRKVVRLGIAPIINTGIAHRRAGVGQIGAGVVRAPLAVFQDALKAFGERYA
jgi:hypothetical protein